MSRHIRRFALILVVVSFALAVGAQGVPAATTDSAETVDLEAIRDVAADTLSAENALEYTAYPYLGWRTNGGPWFNAVLDWVAAELESFGFVEGETAAGPHYWFLTDVRHGQRIWAPQYASLEIVGPAGDAVAGEPYHFDFALDTFDPNSQYYPDEVTHAWLLDNIGTPAEARLNERCHLATNSPFTSPPDTPLDEAEDAARTGELVDVGVVTFKKGKYVWSENAGTDLAGTFLYAAYDPLTGAGTTRGTLYSLAVQEGAAGSLSPQIVYYNDPVIDGEELFPNTVKYAGVGGVDGGPLAFNISPQDARYLEQVLAEATEPVIMKGMAIGSSERFSAEQPLRTLIAEIPGEGDAAEERIPLLAHVQEPGACDNASGIGTQLEVARTLLEIIDAGQLPPPQRTFTLIWGAELLMGRLWDKHEPEAFDATVAALVLDMVGEDPAKTGGPMRIEKMPDPSAVYQYGIDTLPGLEPEPVDAYVRLPDLHSLWGAGELRFWPYPGHFLNDLYFRSADLVSTISPGFVVGSNPWEGGSDHCTFLWNEDEDGWDPKPAALTWHFTDYVYHTSMDTLGMVSRDEERDVALTTVGVGYLLAIAEEPQATEIMDMVRAKADWRFDWERMNSFGSLTWAYDDAAAGDGSPADIELAVANALALEIETLEAWGTWYEEAVMSPRQLLGDDVSAEYQALEDAAVSDVRLTTTLAVVNAEAIAADLVAGL